MHNIQLSELKEGALQERFEMSLAKVLKNIADANTDPKKKRSINIKLEFSPDPSREEATITFNVTEKLESAYKLGTKILIDSSGEDAAEIGGRQPGQRYIDADTGEILDTPRVDEGKLKVIGQ